MGAKAKRQDKVVAQRQAAGSATDLREARKPMRYSKHQWIDTANGMRCVRCQTKVVFDRCVWTVVIDGSSCVGFR